jgi:hypothetical protein
VTMLVIVVMRQFRLRFHSLFGLICLNRGQSNAFRWSPEYAASIAQASQGMGELKTRPAPLPTTVRGLD